jgi:glycyl-tRNA synthetase beta chain
MSANESLVVELYTEELPPKALKTLGAAFAERIVHGLKQANLLAGGDDDVRAFATPRRLGVLVRNVRDEAPSTTQKQKVLPVTVAYDAQGNASAALAKKLAALGLADAAALTREPDGKGESLFYERSVPGVTLAVGLQQALDDAIAKLPIPKVMSYARTGGYYNDVKFVRPAHRLLALHGADIVAISALGLEAGRATGGHRFLGRRDIEVANALAYEETLEAEGKVIASFAERRAKIVAELTAASGGAQVIMPDALLDEVTSLVEWPAVYAGTFDRAFLAVPQECLILTMQQNQKYFALADAEGRLTHRFLLASNLATEDPAAIVQGNERVLRARLADAKFFFDQDRKQRLASRVPKLASVVYHNKLGSQLARVERVTALAGDIAARIGADVAAAENAAHLAKADLVTDMVGEFPELQGLMGRYYAAHDGEPPAVAAAIEQHYWPRYAGDALPESPVAQAVALADKMETLAGMFGIGALPSGDRDPFGLRRNAIGVIRILVEQRLALPLDALVAAAFTNLSGIAEVKDARAELEGFVFERLRGYLRDLGYTANQVEAVLCQRPMRLDRVPAQLEAVRAFGALPESEALAAANKRIINILRKSGSEAGDNVDPRHFVDSAERDLYAAFAELAPVVERRCDAGDYTAALLALATAKPVVDKFFDDVMVMADDPTIRRNRLALLAAVERTMNRVADISKLAA